MTTLKLRFMLLALRFFRHSMTTKEKTPVDDGNLLITDMDNMIREIRIKMSEQ